VQSLWLKNSKSGRSAWRQYDLNAAVTLVPIIVKKEVRVLVLTRKMDEQIVIQLDGRDVFVRVVAIDRDRVRLGIAAPAEVAIHREEVLRRLETGADHATPSSVRVPA
jgi:carbon storage regulator